LLEEMPTRHAIFESRARKIKSLSSDLFRLEVRFLAQEGESFFGLGQHQHGRLDQKGCVIELAQENTEIAIPFALSSRGYGFVWNNPAVGRVELAVNGTCWTANAARQIDYIVIAGDSPAEIMSRYADITGHAPILPEWAAGFWQCKLRYRTQEELLDVAR
jgi:alpha-D-xyloside xylohydrolase